MTTNIIAFAPAYNTGKKKDATGAFQPEEAAFCKLYQSEHNHFLVDNHESGPSMAQRVIDVLESNTLVDPGRRLTVAFFCHGRRKSIQFGFNTRNVDLLARSIVVASRFRIDPCVVLYACNTAGGPGVGGDGGFADLLRDALCRAGAVHCQVDAHVGKGHTTERPFVRRFEGKGSPVGGVGGYFLVTQGSKLWRRWARAIRETTLRYEFPFMSVGEIHERLVMP